MNVKKIILAVSLISIFLTGCSKEVTNETFKEGLSEYNTNLNSYFTDVSLEIKKGEDLVKFDCEVYYLKDDFYKVIMKDNSTNNTQAIVKNNEGVFVLTPLLNKQFKFSNDWPLNSSHAYLYQSLVKDIIGDENSTVLKSDKDYVVTSTFNSKSNAALKQQKVTFTSSYKPLYCVVTNEAEEVQIKATFNEFVDNYSLKASDFDTNAINTSLRLEMGEGSLDTDINTVKPTYFPEDTEVATSVVKDDYLVHRYEGEFNFTITCVKVEDEGIVSVTRLYDEFVLLSCGLAAVNENKITFYKGNVEVTIYSDELTSDELFNIANSF